MRNEGGPRAWLDCITSSKIVGRRREATGRTLWILGVGKARGLEAASPHCSAFRVPILGHLCGDPISSTPDD